MNTPRKILSARETAERVIERMKTRKLDPRLGRWSATERLVPPKRPLPEVDIVRRWAHQLLARWGIVTKDILAAEVAAPPWSALLREVFPRRSSSCAIVGLGATTGTNSDILRTNRY